MNERKTDPNGLNNPPRCQYLTPSRKRCRLHVVDPRSGLCFRHAGRQASAFDAANLRSELAGDVSDFKSASEINDFLSRLLLLLSEGRVTPRRAAVLAYINNLLLRTLPAMDRELNGDSEEPPVRVDFSGLPRPDHHSPPEHASFVLPQT